MKLGAGISAAFVKEVERAALKNTKSQAPQTVKDALKRLDAVHAEEIRLGYDYKQAQSQLGLNEDRLNEILKRRSRVREALR